MTFAPSYIANAVTAVAIILSVLGIHVGNDALQTTITTLLTIATPLFTMVRQVITKRSTLAGTRPQ